MQALLTQTRMFALEFSLLAVLVLGSFPSYAGDVQKSIRRIGLDLSADKLVFNRAGTQLFIASREAQVLTLLDIKEGKRLYNLELDYPPSNIAVGPEDRFAYIVGSALRKGQGGRLTQFDPMKLRSKTMFFFEPMSLPNVAVGPNNQIYISNRDSRTLVLIEENQFFGEEVGFIMREQPHNIFLPLGPGSAISPSMDENILFLSHANASVISVVNTKDGALLQKIGWEGKGGGTRSTPLAQAVVYDAGSGKSTLYIGPPLANGRK